MCSHCAEQLKGDERFLDRLTNTFLIRDPPKAIASYYAMNSKVTADEIGLEQLALVFEQVTTLTGNRPIVVNADDLENDPDVTINAYCQAL